MTVASALQGSVRGIAGVLGLASGVLAVVVLGALVALSPFALLSLPLAANAVLQMRIAGTDLQRERLPFTALAALLAVDVWGLTYLVGSRDLWLFQIVAGGCGGIVLIAVALNLACREGWACDIDC